MRYPLDKTYLTQKFGVNPEAYSQFGLKGHNGWDFRTKYPDSLLGNMPIRAVEDGTVIAAITSSVGYGTHVKLKGVSGNEYVYGHLKSFNVIKGQVVKEGQILGTTDNTGNSTGSHLHFGYRPPGYNPNNGFAGYEDPSKLFVMNKFRLCIINLDLTDPTFPKFPDALTAEINRLSANGFPIEVTLVNSPRLDPPQNLDGTSNIEPIGLKYDYLKSCVDQAGITGYHTVAVMFHWDGRNPLYNIRPRAHPYPYKGMQMVEFGIWQTGDPALNGQDPAPSWIWGITHELCHSIFYRLRSLGIMEPDTTHNGNAGEFSDEFTVFKKYLNQLIGGVTPPPQPQDMYNLIRHPVNFGEVYAEKNKVVRHIANGFTLASGDKEPDRQWVWEGKEIPQVSQETWNTFQVADEVHYDPKD